VDSVEDGGLKDATTDQVKGLIEQYKKSEMATRVNKVIEKGASSAGKAVRDESGHTRRKSINSKTTFLQKLEQQGPKANIFVQLGLLISRGFLNVGREPMLLRARIGQAMAIAILVRKIAATATF